MSKATDAAAMRDAGASIEEIMARFGWSRSYATNRICDGRRGGDSAAKRKASLAERNREMADAALAGESYAELSKRYNLSVPSVARACHSAGVRVSQVPILVDRRLSNIAKAQVKAWADPESRARRIASLRAAASPALRISKQRNA